jgi:hypothetical protein
MVIVIAERRGKGMFSFEKDLGELQVNARLLQPKFKLLIGTRQIIQYETPDYVFTLSKTLKPKIVAHGVTNRCADGLFVLFLEYDRIYKEIVYKNLDNLINRFPDQFDNFYIAKTDPETDANGKIKGSYHVVNFVKHWKSDIEAYVELCDVDPNFKAIPRKTAHKCHVLRLSEKTWKLNGKTVKSAPEFLEVYPKELLKSNLACSKPHYWFFRKHWIFNDIYHAYHKYDEETKLELHKYATPKKEVKE